MPTVTYKGSKKAGANMGRLGVWRWGVSVNKPQEWVDENAASLAGEFLVDGVRFALPEPVVKQDEGNDGIPDMKWTKGDIMSWLDEHEVTYSALNTKAKLIDKVHAYLNPPTEDANSEEVMEDTTGSDE